MRKPKLLPPFNSRRLAEYVIKASFKIIDGYTRLYDEIVAAPAPKELTEEQKQDYKTETKEKAVVLLKSCIQLCKQRCVLAQQAQWEGESYDEILDRDKNALKQELEVSHPKTSSIHTQQAFPLLFDNKEHPQHST